MAEINETVKQLGERVDYYPKYTMTTASFIGPANSISAMAMSNKKGEKYNNEDKTIIESSSTEKIEADRMRWNVSYRTWLSGGTGEDDPYTTQTWSMSMTQYEFPLERYLGPERTFKFEAWKEATLSDRQKFQFVTNVGTGEVTKLSGPELSCAKKYFAGIEAVMKFYPQATRTSVYDKLKTFASRRDALNHIDDTPEGVFDLSCSWLKTGFDWTENNDTSWTLTESWIGKPNNDPWDANFYGPNAWTFYNPTT